LSRRTLTPLVFLLAASCAWVHGPPEEDPFAAGLWPLTTGDRRPWAGVMEQRFLGPGISGGRYLNGSGALDERRLEIRPVYSSRLTSDRASHDVLFPIARWRKQPDGSRGWFAYLARTRRNGAGSPEETTLGPAYRGRTAGGSRYSGLFPFFGKFEERFGFEQIRFVLWPLYARGTRGTYRETQILWPFFAFGQGDSEKKFRFWPFYGVKRREGISVHRFYLWPIVHRKTTKLDTETPDRSFYILPLYGRRDHGPRHSRFYLFPLYLRQWHDLDPRVFEVDVVWPIFSAGRDAHGETHWDLRPLYGVRRGPERSRWSVGLGFLAQSRVHTEDFEEELRRVLWAGRVGWRREGEREARFQDLWPLLRFVDRRDGDGLRQGFLRIPYLLPFRGQEPDGWDRHYNKLFELYGARWRNDERRSSLLFGFRERRDSASERWVSWVGLLHWRH
jgi:hypothetical protein